MGMLETVGEKDNLIYLLFVEKVHRVHLKIWRGSRKFIIKNPYMINPIKSEGANPLSLSMALDRKPSSN